MCSGYQEKDMANSCWSDEPLTMTFESEEELRKFCSEGAKVLSRLLSEHLYNSVTALILFYQDYKAGTTPMPDYYHAHIAEHHAHSLCCVGNSMIAREELLNPESYFMEHYPDLEKYLYYASSNYMAYNWLENIPEQHQERPSTDTAPYKEHIMVALKISLQGRAGYVLMDLGYHIGFPVIVMADGKSPHTKPFTMLWKRGPILQTYHLRGNYVHWTETVCEDPQPPRNRWIYVARKYTKLQEAEKRSRVSAFHAIISRDLTGPTAGIYCVYGHQDAIPVFIKNSEEDEEKSTTVPIPFEYLLSGRNDMNEYETLIDKCATRMKIKSEMLRESMKSIAEIQTDKAFIEPLLKLDTEFSTRLEKCWGVDPSTCSTGTS